MTEAELYKERELLSLERLKLDKEKLEFEQKKLQRLTIAVSFVAVAVSLLQVGVAYIQSRTSQAQTIEKFIPYLQKNETRDAALHTMSSFVDREFVTQLALKLKATAILENLQTKGSQEEKQLASAALSSLEEQRKELVKKIFDSNKMVRIEATSEAIRQWANDPNMAYVLLEFASKNISNHNGIVNTLIVLRELPPESLRANSDELNSFLGKAQNNGQKTAGFVNDVNERMQQFD